MFKKALVINEADKHTQDTLFCTEGHVNNSFWCLDTIVECIGLMVGGRGGDPGVCN